VTHAEVLKQLSEAAGFDMSKYDEGRYPISHFTLDNPTPLGNGKKATVTVVKSDTIDPMKGPDYQVSIEDMSS